MEIWIEQEVEQEIKKKEKLKKSHQLI